MRIINKHLIIQMNGRITNQIFKFEILTIHAIRSLISPVSSGLLVFFSLFCNSCAARGEVYQTQELYNKERVQLISCNEEYLSFGRKFIFIKKIVSLLEPIKYKSYFAMSNKETEVKKKLNEISDKTNKAQQSKLFHIFYNYKEAEFPTSE